MGPESGDIHPGQVQRASNPAEMKEAITRHDFNADYTKIMSRPLSPENIDSYAEDAVKDLIGLIDSILEDYGKQAPANLTKKELEDAALKHCGLTGINEALDHISSKAEEIKQLDEVIDKAVNTNNVMVPPQTTDAHIVEGSGTFKEKLTIARTKTLLFILSNDFDIDVQDPEKLSLTTGILTDKMMRELSYSMIEVPELERIIICCDEEGNTTYIFDRSALEKNGISGSDLINLTKTDLNDLIQNELALGKRVNYSNKFVTNIAALIKDMRVKEVKNGEKEGADQYLYPKAPKGILSRHGIAVMQGPADGTIAKAIEELGNMLGETRKYRFGSQPAIGYTLEQQEMIRQKLKEMGALAEKAPEGVLSAYGIAIILKAEHNQVVRAIEMLGSALGETKKINLET